MSEFVQCSVTHSSNTRKEATAESKFMIRALKSLGNFVLRSSRKFPGALVRGSGLSWTVMA
jgi:hypothetical protein